MKMLVKSELQIEKCKLQNENCGGEADRKFAICNFPPHSGISLTEVLIAMGILTLGLLGVASVFPVGSYYMQKADVADRGSAIAQSVMNDIVARGMLNPSAWCVMTPSPPGKVAGTANWQFSNPVIDGKYCPAKAAISATFTRPFAEALGEGLKQSSNPITISQQFGNAYVIDPMGVAAMATPNTAWNYNRVAYPFPASAYLAPAMGGYYQAAGWNPWKAQGADQQTWPIRRATFQQANGWQMNSTMAAHYFRGSDDLAYDFPSRDDRPAMQNWDFDDTNKNGKADPGEPAVARKWTGDYSWIVTVLPTTNAARNGMARNPESFTYDVSVVVFHKRGFAAAPAQTNAELTDGATHERVVNARILSTGLNGGEILLHKVKDGITEGPYGQLKTGQWIMLCGPHPNSTDVEPRFVLNWYQVLSIDSESPGIPNYTLDPTTERVIAVRGPQWPWQPGTNLTDYKQLSNTLCVGIFRGVVAVHSKTLRLQSPRGGAYGSGMTNIVPPGVTPGYVLH